MIRDAKPGWEEMVPPYVDNMIKDNRLFGYVPPKMEATSGKAQKAKA
jgi:hypothetical protein